MEVERRVRADYAERDIAPALAAANERGGRWELVGRLGRGAWGGAWRVRDGSGRAAVIKCVWDHDWRERLASAARAVDILRQRGAPVPRFLAWGYAAAVGTWHLEELLDGAAVSDLDARLLGDVLAFCELQSGAGDGALYDWSARVARDIEDDPDGELGRAAKHDDQLAALVDWLRAQAAGPPADVVHGDLLATQLLVRDGRLAGVVDWDGAGRGERAQDLALLYYHAHAQADRRGVSVDGDVVDEIARAAVERTGAAAFGRYLAWESLRTVGFVLAHNPRHVEWRVSLALRSVGRFGRLAGVTELARLPAFGSRP